MSVRFRHRCLLLVALTLPVGCGSPPPPLPELDTSVFGPSIGRQIDEALEQARTSPGDAEAQGRLGMTLHAYQQYGAAVEAYERAAALEPKLFEWRYYRGRALASAGRQDEALELLRSAQEIRSDYAPLRIALGELLLEKADAEAAYEHYREAVELDPGSATARYGLAKVSQARGDAAAAIAAFRQALDLAPRFAAAHYALGMLFRDQGKEELAARHLERAEAYTGSGAGTRDVLMVAVAELAEGPASRTREAARLRSSGETEAAIAKLLEAVGQDPDFVPARVNLIQIYSDEGRYSEAEEHYRAAIATSPNAQQARLSHAQALIKQGRLPEAHVELERVVAINPHLADAQVLLGSMLSDRGRPQEAERHYLLALDSKPAHPQANLMMAIERLRAGEPEAAAEHAGRLLESDAEGLSILVYRLALSYRAAGQSVAADGYLSRARQLAVAEGRHALVAEIDRHEEGLK